MNTRRSLVALALIVLVGAVAFPMSGRSQVATGCLDPNVPLTPEEARLTRAIGPDPEPVPDQILRRSGFDRFLAPFVDALCSAPTLHNAQVVVTQHGKHLWRAAVDRVQGRGPEGGDLPRSDDRPLFWARLQLTRALRQWQPLFPLTAEERGALEWTLERASRGQFDTKFPSGRGVRRMFVTGFDPFSLDALQGRGIRIGNPSGAIILTLDGTTLETPKGTVFFEVAIFPVRWRDFTLGMVEDTAGPLMLDTKRRVDGTMTISQGGSRMDVEEWNGRFRTGTDNNNINPCGSPALSTRPECQITPPERWVPFTPPQWTRTTQPFAVMLAAGTGPFTVFNRTSVSEFLVCGQTPTASRPNGPTTLDHCARSGGGGSFLSNEIAYRVTLLRDVFGLSIPAGHLHVPVMSTFRTDNLYEITDEVFEDRRDTIVQQARALVHAVAGTLFE